MSYAFIVSTAFYGLNKLFCKMTIDRLILILYNGSKPRETDQPIGNIGSRFSSQPYIN